MKALTIGAARFDVEVMYWYHVRDCSIREVAKKLDCHPDRVKRVLHKYKPGPRSTQAALALRTTDEYREKLRDHQLGDKNHQAKLTEREVLEIRQRYEELIISNTKTQSQHMLAKRYGVKRPTISDIVLRKTWKHI